MNKLKQKVLEQLSTYQLDDTSRDLVQSIKSFFQVVQWNFIRRFGSVDRNIINKYFSDKSICNLHIGCGEHMLDGWLNADFFLRSSNIIHLDATKRFPIEDNSFDYIYSEHMIEHVPYAGGVSMVNECFRTLKPKGKVRISTPDLVFLVDLYNKSKSTLQNAYIDWSIDNYIGAVPAYYDTFVINNYVRSWGHLFIYDEKTLKLTMEKAGFVDIKSCKINESEEEIFQGIENESRMPEGFLQLESLIIEAKKPDT